MKIKLIVHFCSEDISPDPVFLLPPLDPHTSSKPEDWTAVLGDHSLKERDERFEQRRNILNITIHEGYRSMWYEQIYDTPPLNDVGKCILKHEPRFQGISFVIQSK